MGSQRESERVTGREGEMAGCTVYKRMKEDRKEGGGKAPGACVTDHWSREEQSRGESQAERSPTNE